MTPSSAMIFAAGFGTRMGSLTKTAPKPMLHLAGRPMIDHTIDLLRDAGVSRIAANVHHLPDVITSHLHARGVEVLKEHPDILDTGGGLMAALPVLGNGPVITINPDALWLGPNPVTRLLENWRADMAALLALIDRKDARGTAATGDFGLSDGKIVRGGSFIYGGAQIIDPNRLQELGKTVFSLNAYWDHLAEIGPLNGLLYEGTWCDLGTPIGLETGEALLRHE